MVCLFSAGLHASQGTYLSTYSYFCGQAGLILWALWALRSRRFGLKAWAGALAAILVLGFFGLLGINGFRAAGAAFRCADCWRACSIPEPIPLKA